MWPLENFPLQHTKGTGLVLSATCTLGCGGRTACIIRIVLFPSLVHLQVLIIYSMQKSLKTGPGNEAMHAVIPD